MPVMLIAVGGEQTLRQTKIFRSKYGALLPSVGIHLILHEAGVERSTRDWSDVVNSC